LSLPLFLLFLCLLVIFSLDQRYGGSHDSSRPGAWLTSLISFQLHPHGPQPFSLVLSASNATTTLLCSSDLQFHLFPAHNLAPVLVLCFSLPSLLVPTPAPLSGLHSSSTLCLSIVVDLVVFLLFVSITVEGVVILFVLVFMPFSFFSLSLSLLRFWYLVRLTSCYNCLPPPALS
jgi:hypothetical protein